MSDTHTPTIVIGVTGCIAAYKACELVRTLQREGCRVKVVMTENATRFVGEATFRALTAEPVAVSLWDEPGSHVHHISLAEEADVFAVVPATANVIAKLATGRADDLLTTTALATEAPIVVAPAMNVHMWRDGRTRANVEALRASGAVIVEPESGELACGEVGEGRLASLDTVAEAILAEVRRSRDLEGVRILVTAGPTEEPVDAVRFLGNRSSGKTGYAIAEEAARRGADVTLVSGPTVLPDPFGVKTRRVMTALEMAAAVDEVLDEVDVVIATAAVADVRPVASAGGKLKKGALPESIELELNPDILAGVGERKEGRFLIGFAAETASVLEEAKRKLAEKNVDVVVANDVSEPGLGFGSDANRVWLVTQNDAEELPVLGKKAIARAVWDRFAGEAREAHGRRSR
jgi:phosphopantothenoylcysteine decarboxylase / phosphopantothenate---cysteine ligase